MVCNLMAISVMQSCLHYNFKVSLLYIFTSLHGGAGQIQDNVAVLHLCEMCTNHCVHHGQSAHIMFGLSA